MSRDEGRETCKKRRHSEGSDAVLYPITLNESHDSSYDALSNQRHNVSDSTNLISSDQYLCHYKRPKRNQNHLRTQNVKKIKLMTSSTSEDNIFLNVIESADFDQAIELLKGSHALSQNDIDRALILSCRQGFKFLIQKLVSLGANVEVKDTNGNTPLLICAENGLVDIFSFLLLRKADVNAFNSVGDTALIMSVKASGSSQMVKVLLEQTGIDITHQNQDGYTALMRAIEVRDISTIKLLLDKYKESNLTFNESVNCTGETTEQIAERCSLGNVVRILNRSSREEKTPLVVASETCDIETFNILLDCQFLDDMDMKTSVNLTFRKIFDNFKLRQDKVIDNNEFVMIRRLLVCGASMNMGKDSELFVAVEVGDYKLVELLCQHLHLEQKVGRYYSITEPLKAAAKSGRCDLVELLLQQQANYIGFYTDSPLDNALSHKHFECAQLLVQHGATMNIGQALVSAVNQGEPGYMNFLFDNYKPDILNYVVNNADRFHYRLLPAARSGSLEIIKHLLDAGADVNYGRFEETPLSESKNGEVAKFLISRGANVNHVTHISKTPLLNFLLNRHDYNMDVIDVLLENGASVNGRNSDGRTPLILAASKAGSVAVLKTLLDHGANFNDQDDDGNTALIEAADVRCPENILFLVQFSQEKKYSIDVQNQNRRTALIRSAELNTTEIVKLLIDHGADVNIKSLKGNTALLLLLLFRPTKEILTALITAGSDVNYQNDDGFSPLMLAVKARCSSSVSTLLDAGADVNAVSKEDKTKTALTCLSDNTFFKEDDVSCLKVLLERGANSSFAYPDVLPKLIFQSELEIIPKLIRSGIGPQDLIVQNNNVNCDIVSVSPLCMALRVGNVPLAKYFVGNLFLTDSDVSSLLTDNTLRLLLEDRGHQDCVSFLDELSSQPMSLFQLAFVKVSSAIGASPGRENRVNMLPIPQVMKDKLLFQSENVTLSFPAGLRDTISNRLGTLNIFKFLTKLDPFSISDDDEISDESGEDEYYYDSDENDEIENYESENDESENDESENDE